MNNVYLMDCMDFMKTIEDNYFELAIVDPEYGISCDKEINTKSIAGKGLTFKRKQNNHKPKNWDNKIPDKIYFEELKRVSKNQIIWGGNYFTEYLKPTKSWVFWHKKIVNANDKNFSDGEMAWTSFKKITKYFCYDWIGFGYINSGEKKIHVTQKPVALYKWLLTNYAKEGDKIFDSHVGSGSSRIAAYELGFDFTGCELDKDYWQAQEKRFESEKARIDDKFYIPKDEMSLFNV